MAREDFTNSDDYDPDAIYSGSQDPHGHSINMRFHIPKSWMGPLQRVANSPEWPEYDHANSIIRDALYHRFHWIDQQKDRGNIPGVKRAMALVKWDQERIEQERNIEEAIEFEEKIEGTVTNLVRAGDQKAAMKLLNEFEDTVRETFNDPHLTALLDTIERLRKRVWR